MKRAKHSLSNYKLLTMDMGELIPIGLMEVLPGDTIQQATSALVRCAPLLSPVMHPVDVRIHHWYVPHRLVWDEFEDFITAGPAGTSLPVFPTQVATNVGSSYGIGTLFDYLGVPPVAVNTPVSALPARGYQMIWNEHYRDQDLENLRSLSTTSGVDVTTSFSLNRVSWEKDYFTSSRPWEQKGPTVTVPLGTTAPVITTSVQQTIKTMPDGITRALTVGNVAGVNTMLPGGTLVGSAQNVIANNPTGLTTDLTGASAVTVTALRQALALQRFEEARARYGSRYTEYLRYLGIKSSDARLQRPEYLGGGRQTIQFSEVLATAEGTNTDVGDLKGHGIAAMRSNRYRRFFEEHGYVHTLMSVKPKTMYTQGLARHWNRRNKEDYWQKEFEAIGQQAVKNKEVYVQHSSPDGTFGYQDRYDEYRRTESSIAGEFRTSALDYWHLGRVFSSDPGLNAIFVSAVPTKRVFASQATDCLYVMAKHSIQARRLVSKTGNSFIF